ncbi:hypothetical protein AWB81_06429 [Caballeronia arationis]|jgi:hypothetical protein|uniref:hypothetical protein n=1 Tax=Caballeronia arationis TaxID=1777142 RepID=UPI00074C44C2|nr:hypothetical protein [Caballeronia arationis]SAL03483.1 hypothetical protein AWB81_06429 [Caballeronia arationis]
MQTEAQLLRTIHEAKAVLHDLQDECHPRPPRAEERLLRAEETIEAMDVAAALLAQIEQELDKLNGTDKWPKALEIAFNPCDLDGYHLVAEYYRRLDAIRAL